MENQNLPEVQITNLELDYQGTTLPCPIQEGHHMVPVKTVCQIIDIDFKTQDNWLKSHPVFTQLYRLAYTTGADGKQYEMRCLPLFDLYAWLSSITQSNRKDGSSDKQFTFMIWLRTQMLDMYKSIQVSQAENRQEQALIEEKEDLEQRLLQIAADNKEVKARLKLVEEGIENIRINRYTGQTALKFPE